MAFKGKIVHNAKTGQTLEFFTTSKESNGALLEMFATYKPHSKEPPAHYHPLQDERFTVIEGEMCVRLKGKVIMLRQGESIDIPRNTIHSMWNNSAGKTIMHWCVMPALKTEYFLETLMGLSKENKTDDHGKPGLLRIAYLAYEYRNEFRLAKPSYAMQKIVAGLLRPIPGGKKSNTKNYTD